MTKNIHTVWSRGRLLGETVLDEDCSDPCARVGWLTPNDEAAELIPRATINATSEALIAIGRLLKSVLSGEGRSGFSKLENTTEFADVTAAMAHEEAFALELRRADGSTVPTERIAIMDTHRLMSGIDEESDDDGPAFDDAIEDMADDVLGEWESEEDDPQDQLPPSGSETEIPRYQIYVRLLNDTDLS